MKVLYYICTTLIYNSPHFQYKQFPTGLSNKPTRVYMYRMKDQSTGHILFMHGYGFWLEVLASVLFMQKLHSLANYNYLQMEIFIPFRFQSFWYHICPDNAPN